MKNIKDYLQEQEINEAKIYFYKSDKLIIYGGDHEIDRMYDRKITNEIIEKTLNKFDTRLIELVKDKEISEGDEIVIRNKNTNPYLNLPIKFIEIKNNKYIFVIKTGMYKNDFKTDNKIFDLYA